MFVMLLRRVSRHRQHQTIIIIQQVMPHTACFYSGLLTLGLKRLISERARANAQPKHLESYVNMSTYYIQYTIYTYIQYTIYLHKILYYIATPLYSFELACCAWDAPPAAAAAAAAAASCLSAEAEYWRRYASGAVQLDSPEIGLA